MTHPYRDPAVPRADRVEDLLARMTVTEKVGQLNQRLLGWDVWARTSSGFELTGAIGDELERFGSIGAIYGLQRADAWSGRDWRTGADPALSAELSAAVQERIVAGNRLGIPALFVEETVHGHQALGSQLFPVAVSTAATWRPELVEEASAHVGDELRARGVHLALVPGLDMLRDPRWGRSEETYGEDPLLASLFLRAMVRGLHAGEGIAAVLKAFAGQGAGIGGRNSAGAPLGPRELREVHLPAARAGIEEGALGVMAAYSDIDGVPCIADRELLTGILREQWGFEGIVMADMFAIDRLMRAAEGPAAAAALALRAGVDLSMCDVSYTAVEEALASGLAEVADLDAACRRVLDLKVRLGLLDPPPAAPVFPAPRPADDLVAAGFVLLQNRGDILPLAANAHVAVVGPNGDDLEALLGDYTPPLAPGVGSTVLAGARAAFDDGAEFEAGSELNAPIEGGLERASRLAAAADVVLLAVGSSSGRDYADDFQSNGAAALGGRAPHATTGEGYDLAEVRLPDAQLALARAVAATGTPIVAIVVSGRPHGIDELAAICDAVLWAGYPGPEGGRVLGDLLLGRREPVGRLPFSLPRSSGTLPVAYNERLEIVLRYIDGEAAATFPFGAGIGWGTAELGEAEVDAASTTPDRLQNLVVSAPITAGGSAHSIHSVQLYGRARIPGILPRKSVLLGFASVELDAGERRTVKVAIEADALPHLGIAAGTRGRLQLWLSLDGATVGNGEPEHAVIVDLV